MSFDFGTLVFSKPPGVKTVVPHFIAGSTAKPVASIRFDTGAFIEKRQERADISERWLERAAILEFDGGLDREIAERTAWSEIVAHLPKGKRVREIPDPMPWGATCPYCHSRFLVDDPDGCRCWLCERLAWVTTPDGGIVRADFVEVEL